MSVAYAGIDPSIANTGLVILNRDISPHPFALDGKCFADALAKRAPPAFSVLRYAEQAKYVAACLPAGVIAAYEDYSYGSEHKAYSLAEFGGILKAELAKKSSCIYLATPQQVKLFAAGHGLADKEEVKAAALVEEPSFNDGASFDVCDAYFLAKMAWYADDPEGAANAEAGRVKRLRLRLETAKKLRMLK